MLGGLDRDQPCRWAALDQGITHVLGSLVDIVAEPWILISVAFLAHRVQTVALSAVGQPRTWRHALVRSTIFWLIVGAVLLGVLFLPFIHDRGAFTYRLV